MCVFCFFCLFKSIEFKHIWLWPLCVCGWPLAQSVFFFSFLSDSNLRAEDLSPGNNCCCTSSSSSSSSLFSPPTFVFLGPRWMGQRAQKTSASPPPSWLWCPSAPIFRQKPPLFYAGPPPSVCIQSNYLSSIKINNSWLGWCGQRL